MKTSKLSQRITSAILAFALSLSMVPAVSHEVQAVDTTHGTNAITDSEGSTSITVNRGNDPAKVSLTARFTPAEGMNNEDFSTTWMKVETERSNNVEIKNETSGKWYKDFDLEINTANIPVDTIFNVTATFNYTYTDNTDPVNPVSESYTAEATYEITVVAAESGGGEEGEAEDEDEDEDEDLEEDTSTLVVPDSLDLSLTGHSPWLGNSIYISGQAILDINTAEASTSWLKTAAISFTVTAENGTVIDVPSVDTNPSTTTGTRTATIYAKTTYGSSILTVTATKDGVSVSESITISTALCPTLSISPSSAETEENKEIQTEVSIGFENASSATTEQLTAEREKITSTYLKWYIPEDSSSYIKINNITSDDYPLKVYFNTSSIGDYRAYAYLDYNGDGAYTYTDDYKEIAVEFPIEVAGISLDPEVLSLKMYEVSYVKATAPDDVALSWSSSNTTVVEWRNIGGDRQLEVKGASAGSTVITVSGGGYSAEMTITVSDNAADPIVTSGEINSMRPLYFSDILSQLQSESWKVFGESLAYISNLSFTPGEGIIYYGYKDTENTGAGVGSNQAYYVDANPKISDLVFLPLSPYSGDIAILEYKATTTGGSSYTGEIHVQLNPLSDVEVGTTADTPVTLVSDTFQAVCSIRMGQPLRNVVFSLPDENRAVLYFDYKTADDFGHALAHGEEVISSHISRVTVVPTPGYSGVLEIPYVATTNTATTYTGILTVVVDPYGADGPVVYNTMYGQHVTFDAYSFEENSLAVTFQSLDYVNFTLPDSSQGILYEQYVNEYNYRKEVSASTDYNASSRSPYIGDVTFVPADGFTGSVNIPFVGYDVEGNSYLGTVQVNVTTYEEGDINYVALSGGYASFHDGDFNSLCRTLTGDDLNYVTFTLPSSSQGTLRYGQTYNSLGSSVTASTKYYYEGSPILDNISFQVQDGYTGVVRILFKGYAENEAFFTGVVTVAVSNQLQGEIIYTIDNSSVQKMQVEDFQHVSYERTDSNLSYVRFQLPSASVGTLYHDYESSTNPGSPVTESTNYYNSGSSYLSKVYFVPHASFTGTAQINFTGWGTNGKTFYGMVTIHVEEGLANLYYLVPSGEYIYLSGEDISQYCFEETGSTLNHILISAPTATQGKLYRNYDPESATHSSAGTTTKYYRSQSPYVEQLAFMPADDYYGIVELNFKATAISGDTCEGTVTIRVMAPEANSAVIYSTTFSPVQFDVNDFNAVWDGSPISSLVFHTMPGQSQGKLYYENKITSLASVETDYFSSGTPNISEMIFAPVGNFRGTVVLPYTATTIQGSNFSGEVHINVSAANNSVYFTDMGDHTWAITSVDFLRSAGVTGGLSTYYYGPGQSITRGDFALMLVKAFGLRSAGTTTAFSDVPNTSYYYDSIYILRSQGIAEGYNNMFQPKDPISRQDAMVMLASTMKAAGKTLDTGNVSNLLSYQDYDDVADYALESISALTEAGIIAGNPNGNISPNSSMTRAEMAVVLHNAMTY